MMGRVLRAAALLALLPFVLAIGVIAAILATLRLIWVVFTFMEED